MANRFTAIPVNQFRGLQTITRPQDLSSTYSPACQNNMFLLGSTGTRPGTSTKFTLSGGTEVFHMELLTLASPFTKYYVFLEQDHVLYYTTSGTQTALITAPAVTVMFKTLPYSGLAGFVAFSDGYVGTTAPYVITPTPASALLTSTLVDVADGNTVTIDGVVYTFRTTLTAVPVANEVKIGLYSSFFIVNGIPSWLLTLGNLREAINAGSGVGYYGGQGAGYSYLTKRHPTVTATEISYVDSTHLALRFEAKLPGTSGNSIGKSKSSTPLSWDSGGSGTVFSGGGGGLNADLATVAPPANGAFSVVQTATAYDFLNSDASGPSDSDTVTVGGTVYTFKTALTGAANEVLISTTTPLVGNSLSNLAKAIMAGDGEGILYGTGTVVNASVIAGAVLQNADGTGSLGVQALIPGIAGNSIAATETSAHLSWTSATLLHGVGGNSGNITAGDHKLAIIYVTRSGYFSRPSDPIIFTAPGLQGLTLSGIPVHPDSQVINRLLAMTEAGKDRFYLLDKDVKDGIGNNTSTSFITPGVDDATLSQQLNVDDYFRNKSPLSGAIGMLVYHDRMIVWGDGDDTSRADISEPGHPQQFLGDTSFQEIRRDDGQRLIAAFVMRDNLYYVKERSMHATQDTGSTVDTWSVGLIAEDVGTPSVNGVDSFGGDRGFAAILDPKGIYLFQGAAPQKISNYVDMMGIFPNQGWGAINKDYLFTAEIHIDAVNNRIMAWVPVGSATRPNQMIVADYREGFDKIKWDTWSTQGTAWRSFVIDGPETVIATAGTGVRYFDDSLTWATVTLTSDNVNPADGDEVRISYYGASFSYIFKTTLTGAALEIQIGADADTTLGNLKAAINLEAGSGTKYGTGTTVNTLIQSGSVASHAIILTGSSPGAAGNNINCVAVSAHLTFSSSFYPGIPFSATVTSGGGLPFTTSDNGAAIDTRYRTGVIPSEIAAGMNLFQDMDIHAEGKGSLTIKIYGPDGTLIKTPSAITLSAAAEQDLHRWLNIRKERIFVEFSQNDANSYYRVNNLVVNAKKDGVRGH